MGIKTNSGKAGQGFVLMIFVLGILFNACNSKQKIQELTLPPASDDFYEDIIKYSGIDFIRTVGDEHLSIKKLHRSQLFIRFGNQFIMILNTKL